MFGVIFCICSGTDFICPFELFIDVIKDLLKRVIQEFFSTLFLCVQVLEDNIAVTFF